MRSTMIGLVLGRGLMVAAVPALACSFNTQASTDSQAQQRTAQTGTGSATRSE